MARRIMPLIVGGRFQHAAADAHALEIDDRLGEDRESRRLDAVGTGVKILAQRDGKLVIDPAMRRVPLPGIRILGWDIGGRLDVIKKLKAPWIDFADRHGSDDGRRTTDDKRTYPQPVV